MFCYILHLGRKFENQHDVATSLGRDDGLIHAVVTKYPRVLQTDRQTELHKAARHCICYKTTLCLKKTSPFLYLS